jgi:hypothetical protein
MGRNRKQNKELQNALNNINESSRTVAENTGQISEKLDDIKNVTEKSSKSKIPLISLIVAIITLLVAVGGLSVVDVYHRLKSVAEVEEADMEAESAVKEPEYEIYLYSEYSKVKVGVETEMTATLNFEADEVTITAFFESGGKETMQLNRKSTMEWQKKVYFDKLGVHEIIVTATAPNGEIAENSIEIEVIPISIDVDMINQFLDTGL